MQKKGIINSIKLQLIINMMLSPGTVLKNATEKLPFFFSFIVSATAFGLFLFQTGLDLYKTGQQPISFIVAVSLIGVFFGIIIIPLMSLIIWCISKIFGCQKNMKCTISAYRKGDFSM